MIQRIVMFEGGVETLDYFSKEMAKTFTQKGYKVFFHDLRRGEESARKLRKFIKPKETAMVTFNFEGLQKERGLYREGEGYLWDGYKIPCYNIAADHPYYYHEQLRDLPQRFFHLSIDRNHAKYFKEFYPEYKEAGFLPLAGMEYGTDGQQAERNIDVLMVGNYTTPSFCEPYIHQINEEYAAFYQGIIDELIEFPKQTVEDVALMHCEREMGKVPYDQLRMAFHRMIFIDLYIRNYWRGMVIKTLAEAGIMVDVVGKGWEELDCKRKECLRIHPQTDSLTCLKMLRQAKVSVNVMPWFKDGAHDRVFSSVLNGALSLTDKSRYLCGELEDGEGVCYYDLRCLETLPQQVNAYLSDEKLRQEMVQRGLEKVQKGHTWEQRAEQLIELFQTSDS